MNLHVDENPIRMMSRKVMARGAKDVESDAPRTLQTESDITFPSLCEGGRRQLVVFAIER
jgi:hypothetical protein